MEPERRYLALASYLPLTRFSLIGRFLKWTREIRGQLESSRGLIGDAFRAKLLARKFWTLSAWEDEGSLSAFVGNPPHREVMETLRPHMGATKFVRWHVPGSAVPPSWDEGLRRLGEGEPTS